MRHTVIVGFEKELATDQKLWALVEEFLMREGSQETQASLSKYSRVWAEIIENDGLAHCSGIATIVQGWFVPIFHSKDERTTSRMMSRVGTVIEEHYGGKNVAMVHISPDEEERWKPVLEAIGAKKASMWVVPTSAKLELREPVGIEAT